jgi:hypothetical protein
MPITEYVGAVARSSATSDVFNVVTEKCRGEILDAPRAGQQPAGAIVDDLCLPQPQMSKHLRCSPKRGWSAGRRGVAGCAAWNPTASGRSMSGWPGTRRRGTHPLGRLGDYLTELPQQGEQQ